MRRVIFNGPQDALRLRGSGRVLKRGVPTDVTDAEADRLAASGRDVTIPEPEPEPEPETDPDD